MDKKRERENFLREIELSVEQEYNMPGKPEFAEKTDRNIIKEKLEKVINKFCTQNHSSEVDSINYVLEMINEKRGVSPKSNEEFNLIEEVLYSILEENKKEIEDR